jgi:hypothetical protein
MSKTAFHLENIFAVQCRLVGADYNSVDRTKKDWYLQYEWTPEVEKQFEDWMVDYLHKLPKAQLELYGRKYMRKDECREAVKMFLLSYGWKTKTKWPLPVKNASS